VIPLSKKPSRTRKRWLKLTAIKRDPGKHSEKRKIKHS
jgi:hypothetical protein